MDSLSCFQVGANILKTARNNFIHDFWWAYTLNPLGCEPRSGVSGPQSRHVFGFSKYFQVVFQSG